ncbi:helix-turn-helix domain-containing protein [Leptospirillum ferriphilum]|uniref:helix-turn-helix domain-containing protein n=1 Tax=Leptospirillum ferriphilum TaxID=178606 RepID=UPI0009DA588F|nr:helix-turn-helix domain-containing protein [Leptospirillum ferriphilum]
MDFLLDLLPPKETAKLLGVQEQTLAAWRLYGRDLPYVRVGRLIRYRKSDVLAWIEKHLVCTEAGG